jgi:hypothetical protein
MAVVGEYWKEILDLGGEAGVIGRRGEKGEGGMERRVGLKGVGWMRRREVRVRVRVSDMVSGGHEMLVYVWFGGR